jgi:hypothetical protein
VPTPDRLRPAPYIAGLAGTSSVTLIGVWLIIAPFAVGYQPDGADWVAATFIGVATGAVLIVLGLAPMIVLAATLRDEARRRGIIPRAVDEVTANDEVQDDLAADESTDEPADLQAVLAPLAAALLEDLRDGHEGRQIEDLVDHPSRNSPDHPPA